MGKRDRVPIASVGWLFWFIVFVLALGPAVYLSFQVVDEDQAAPIPVGMGVILAGFLAAIVAWIVNAILFQRGKRIRAMTRKKVKKR
jgi:threonine/homoserine/homoserine lactone efflux protein